MLDVKPSVNVKLDLNVILMIPPIHTQKSPDYYLLVQMQLTVEDLDKNIPGLYY